MFFGRWNLLGLSPDAALYAGLSLKVHQSSEFWFLTASQNFFPHFFEHPPYFFQWGSFVLNILGVGDGAARAIGGIPGFLGFMALVSWSFLRLGFSRTLVLVIMLLSFGHYTKYATTTMMEGPLSLGVVLAMIGVVEFIYLGAREKFPYLLCALGCMISVASKGVAGLGAFGAIVLTLLLIRSLTHLRFSLKSSVVLLCLCLFFSLLPLGVWALATHPIYGFAHSGDQPWYFMEYFQQQVLRSFTSNRGSDLHSVTGSRWLYFQVILKYGWPWWWTVPMGYFYLYKKRLLLHLNLPVFSIWAFASFACFLSFFVPFSLSTFQLPHYIHPVYLPLAPVGAVFVHYVLNKFSSAFLGFLERKWCLPLLALLLLVFMFSFYRGVSKSSNRGQDFIEVSELVNSSKPECEVVLESKDMDAYRMESFSLWYFRGRNWSRVDSLDLNSKSSEDRLIWYPQSHRDLRMVVGKNCQ